MFRAIPRTEGNRFGNREDGIAFIRNKKLHVHEIAPGVGDNGDAVLGFAARTGALGQSPHVVDPGEPRAAAPRQRGGRGQCKAYAREGTRPPHAGDAAERGKRQAQPGEKVFQGRSQQFRAPACGGPILGAEKFSVPAENDLHTAFGGVERQDERPFRALWYRVRAQGLPRFDEPPDIVDRGQKHEADQKGEAQSGGEFARFAA